MLRSATTSMLPPRPPSPPSGPPRGTYFSRRNDTAPLPPSPAYTSMIASSTNFTAPRVQQSLRFPSIQHEALGVVTAAAALPRDRVVIKLGRSVRQAAVLDEQRGTRVGTRRLFGSGHDARELIEQR